MVVQKKTSAAAFEAMLDLPENADKTLELIDGEALPGFSLPIKDIFSA